MTIILRHNSLLLIALASFFLWIEDVSASNIFQRNLYMPAPVPLNTTFVDREKNKLTLSDFKGKVIIVTFWATWCEPCVREMPDLNSFIKKYEGRGVELVTLSQNFRGFTSIDPFLMRHGLEDMPAYWDRKNKLFRAFSASALPTTVIIDRKGKEIGRAEGFIEWSDPEVHEFVESLL